MTFRRFIDGWTFYFFGHIIVHYHDGTRTWRRLRVVTTRKDNACT